MQRLIKRTKTAQGVAARRTKKIKEHAERGESWARNQQRVRMVRETNQRIRQSRIDRAVDWEAGLLAPRRDVGDKAKTYGALHAYSFNPPTKNPDKRPKWAQVAEGDRAVITRGVDRGRIGVVNDVDLETATVRMKDLNMIDIVYPESMKREVGEVRDVITSSQALSLEDVQLVYPLPDPETGVPRDVIIDRVRVINRTYDKGKREWDQGDRVILGTNTIIPWPEKGERVHEDYDSDTLRISLEEQTFRPFLIRPPMPLSVIDELRNKYSRFRTRHDYDYQMKKQAEDAKDEKRKDLIKTMHTPLQELAELRARRKKEEERELTSEQLAKIGEVIAQERTRAMSAARALNQ